MASSSKVVFRLETLRERATEALETKIKIANSNLAAHYDDRALAEAVAKWRAEQEKRVAELASALHEDGSAVADATLAAFSVDDMPSRDRWRERECRQRLEYLITRRAEVEAKSSALVPDADGNVHLTKTQLREFFDL